MKASLHHRFVILLLFLLSGTGYFAQPGTVYSHTQPIDSNLAPVYPAEFSIYVPGNVVDIKGIYLYVPGVWDSSTPIVYDPVFRQMAHQQGVIIMGCKIHPRCSREAHIWGADALLHSLDSLSVIASQPSIKDLPIFFEGYSLGGQFAYHFTRLYPQKVIGFVTMKGGKHTQDSADAATRAVPSLWFKGELDNNFRKENMDSIFNRERPQGALWTLILEKGKAHDYVNDTNLIFGFFRSVLQQRVEVGSNQLKDLTQDEQCGYLMQNSLFQIASYNCAPFVKSTASWMPNQSVAKAAQKLASQGIVTTDYNSCASSCAISVSEVDQVFHGISVYPNPVGDIVNVEAVESRILSISLLGLDGRLLLWSESNQIDVSSLGRGYYTLKVKTTDGIGYQRILKH